MTQLPNGTLYSETEMFVVVRLYTTLSANLRLQILTLVGQYDIWVRRGAISISGAVLRPSSRLHRVHAPSTHSLPPIRPLQDPYGSSQQLTELTILACGDGIRSLKQVSTRFRRIWNHKHVPTKRNGPAVDLIRRSFVLVGSSPSWKS